MNDRDYNDTDLDAPEKLRKALMQSQVRGLVVPPAVDHTILQAAREHLKPATSKSPDQPAPAAAAHSFWEELCAAVAVLVGGRRLAPFTVAVVAMVAAGLMVWQTVHPRAAARAEDLNADGQVDMLDAFALARELQQGRTPRPQLDLNGDGVVDERDVQILAARAVSLETGGHS